MASTKSWLDGLLGRIFSRDVELELSGGTNYTTPLKATQNPSTGRIDVSLDYDSLPITIGELAGNSLKLIRVNSGATGVEFTSAPTLTGLTCTGTPTITGRLSLATTLGNVCVGTSAGSAVTTATSLTALGNGAGAAVTTGVDNSCFGRSAGAALTTGARNTAIGRGAMLAQTTADNCTAVGTYALVASVAAASNTAVGYGAMFASITGTSNTGVGFEAGRYLTSGSANTDLDNCTFLGNGARASADNQVQLGNSATTTYAYGAVQDRSDARDKTDVRNTILGLDFVSRLRPVDFRWDRREQYQDAEEYEDIEVEEYEHLDEETREISTRTRTVPVTRTRLVQVPRDGSRARQRYHHGLIAQEVKRVCDELGVDFGGYQDHSIGGGEDVLSIGYAELVAPLIRAVQELSERVVKLEGAKK